MEETALFPSHRVWPWDALPKWMKVRVRNLPHILLITCHDLGAPPRMLRSRHGQVAPSRCPRGERGSLCPGVQHISRV